MKNDHILDILDNDLSRIDSPEVETHAAHCDDCRRAVEAARISSVLLRAENAEAFAPSPFFETKILNAIRQRQNLRKPLAAFRRWWQASAALVTMMVLIVAGLIALTVFAPSSGEANDQAIGTSDNPYSAEAALLNRNRRPNLTTEQSLEIIYTTKK